MISVYLLNLRGSLQRRKVINQLELVQGLRAESHALRQLQRPLMPVRHIRKELHFRASPIPLQTGLWGWLFGKSPIHRLAGGNLAELTHAPELRDRVLQRQHFSI
ncbi:hypothetical protein DR999_PMT19112 [Platysternon megacephalum]|uniref:Uncharacterized protein n=1 Tax=Platysternon megacephalum TaxID=55544 RepID=A0A4D9DPA9_9SAUR|nr:hypothetical protein DR999_PMT19112 [Platysternon megacephalum]